MNRIIWILVASYVALAAGLVVSVALEAGDLFGLLAVVLLVLAAVQWLVLSRRGDRPTGPDGRSGPIDRPQNRS